MKEFIRDNFQWIVLIIIFVSLFALWLIPIQSVEDKETRFCENLNGTYLKINYDSYCMNENNYALRIIKIDGEYNLVAVG